MCFVLPPPPGKAKFSDLLIPWATFTEPEVAHVGLYPRDMDAKSIAYDTYTKKVYPIAHDIHPLPPFPPTPLSCRNFGAYFVIHMCIVWRDHTT